MLRHEQRLKIAVKMLFSTRSSGRWSAGIRLAILCPLPVAPFGQCSAAEIALGRCTENRSAAGIPDLARSARGSSETEDGKKST